ncbi:MAG TPA: hypothetical protein VNK23_10900 [Candidatus Dormibacteraeota bacterium]|nr:hypothetical protein [Candidatus Dormibacteraeota bacterium]
MANPAQNYKVHATKHSEQRRLRNENCRYFTVTVTLTGAAFVTVPRPCAVTCGAMVTTYVLAPCVDVVVELAAPPQATKDSVSMTATTTSHSPADCLRRMTNGNAMTNGSPGKSAQNVAVPPPFHGAGARFSASAFVVIVTVELAVAPALNVTAFANEQGAL